MTSKIYQVHQTSESMCHMPDVVRDEKMNHSPSCPQEACYRADGHESRTGMDTMQNPARTQLAEKETTTDEGCVWGRVSEVQ